MDAALEYAAELAQRTGQGNAYLMGFGPTNVGLWRMAAALEIRDYERAATIAEGLNPKAHPSRERRATYWMDYGRALARLRGRQDDAVRALRVAEELFPMRVLRGEAVEGRHARPHRVDPGACPVSLSDMGKVVFEVPRGTLIGFRPGGEWCATSPRCRGRP